MLQLPTPEMIVFLIAGCLYVAAAVVGILQLSPPRKAVARLLMPLLCMAVCLQAVVLVFRAVDIQAIPLTGLFESMLVLTIVLSFLYIFMSLAIPQVWFGSLMSWILLGLVVLAAVVAEPASVLASRIVVTPWIVFHALSMVISSAFIVFSAASAFLYLLSDYRLKQKKVLTVLGRVPNSEWLRRATHIGLKGCFVSLTLGVVSGIGMAFMQSTALGMRFVDWLWDPKMICIAAAWLLLAAILCMHRCARLSDKHTAYATVVAFFLILFAFVGVALLGNTMHEFTKKIQGSGVWVQSLSTTELDQCYRPQLRTQTVPFQGVA